DSGSRPGRAPRVLRYGLVAGVALGALGALAVGVAAIMDAQPRYEAVEGLSSAGLLLAVLVVYPLVTVLPEGLAFRGVLLGAWSRAAGTRTALLAASVAFSLCRLTGVAGLVVDAAI